MTRCHRETESPLGANWTAPNRVDPVIQTPRLLLRVFTLDDAEALFRAVNADRDTLAPWVPWAKNDHREIHQTYAFIAEQMSNTTRLMESRGLALGVFDAQTEELVGGHGFHDVRADTASCEIGYWMRSSRRGEGLIGEATAYVLSWLFTPQADGGLGIQRVRIYCSAKNTASSRVPEKLGLPAEVRQRRDYFVEGHGPTDRLGWGVLCDEWDREHHRMEPGR